MNNQLKHPFNTPDDYFDTLKESIMKETTESTLNNVDPKNIYNVPEGFFEAQYGSIIDKKGNPIKNTFRTSQSFAWASLAIAACLFCIFAYTFFETEEINEILSKEGKVIQSNINKFPPPSTVDSTTDKIEKDSLKARRK